MGLVALDDGLAHRTDPGRHPLGRHVLTAAHHAAQCAVRDVSDLAQQAARSITARCGPSAARIGQRIEDEPVAMDDELLEAAERHRR